MEQVILIEYGELTTKKGNRNFFVQTLKQNIQAKLKNISCEIISDPSRMMISSDNLSEVQKKIGEVFGIHAYHIAYKTESTEETINETVLEIMKNKKRWLALGLVGIMTLGCFAGCGSKSDGKSADGKGDSSKGSVYYLNFKPEQDEQWQQLAKDYTKETGVDVTVVTAASGNYETTLMSEMGKSGAPTLFQVNGPVGLANWKDYCYDLSDSDIYKELTSDDYALKDGDSVAGIGYVIETYGIITNKTLLKEAGYTPDDIKSFADLKLSLIHI